jgi:hypothetical protein
MSENEWPAPGGTYRLTAPVPNPHPDRRASQTRLSCWESWAEWPQGMVFLVHERPVEGGFPKPSPYIVARGGIKNLFPWDAAFHALAAKLERVEEKPSDLIRRLEGSLAGGYALEVIDNLLTLEQVAEALEAIHRKEEE